MIAVTGATGNTGRVIAETLLAKGQEVRVIGRKNFGIEGGELRADLRVPMIATRDIAVVAADLLQKRNFTGKQARELHGQRDLTYREVTSMIGHTIGKADLSYVQLLPEQLKPAMIQMGISPQVADQLLELAEALSSGHIVALERRSAANTTPTSIEEFVAKEFVPRFRAMAARA